MLYALLVVLGVFLAVVYFISIAVISAGGVVKNIGEAATEEGTKTNTFFKKL